MLCVWAYGIVEGAVAISQRLGIPKIVIGSIIMSFATTSPELLVSATAVANEQVGIALGNIFGSFIANIGLVLGCLV